MSWIRIWICISPYGSGSGADFYYSNPDPTIRIRITDSSFLSFLVILDVVDSPLLNFFLGALGGGQGQAGRTRATRSEQGGSAR